MTASSPMRRELWPASIAVAIAVAIEAVERAVDLFALGVREGGDEFARGKLTAWVASASSRETPTIGLPVTSAQAFTVVSPTRTPVNEPGPEAAT